MAVDYLSTLNSKGSGLNITQIVGGLVDAEIVPQRERLSDQLAKEELSITAIGALRAELQQLRTTLETPGAGSAYEVSSTSSAVAITLSDVAAASPFDAEVEVTALAAAQVLEFGGFDDPLGALPTGTLTVTIGGDASGAQQVTLTSPANTLTDLAGLLDGLEGVQASVLAVGDGTYSLVLKSDTGADAAITIAADTADLAALEWAGSGDDGSAQMSVDGTALGITRAEARAAADAVLVVDGVTLRRSSNVIDDLVPGAVIEITATTATAARVRSVERADVALAELQALVAGMNAARSAITEATRRGINGAEAGPLAGDPVAERIGRMLQSITTAPLTGFAERDVYLSEIGVMTRRDGTLEVNEAVFGASLARDPALYRAVFQSLSQADVAGVTVSGATSSTPSGAFDFVYTDATTATLDGDALIPRTMPAGDTAQEFYAVTGRFAGVRLRLEAGAEADATILIGTSLLDRTVATLSGLLSTAGDIAAREDSLQTTARDLEDRLTRLDDKAALAEARYRERFTAMEGLVTQIKSSGEYMTALMDAWNKQD